MGFVVVVFKSSVTSKMIIQKHTHNQTNKQQATNYCYYHLEKFQHRLAWENTNTYIDKNYRRNFN
jgi:hypothetical protein